MRAASGSRFGLRVVGGVLAAALAAGSAPAIDYYWDADGDASATLGGSGTWNTSNLNWRNGSATGPVGTWVNSTTSIAFLQGTSGTLAASGGPQVNKINVTSGSFTLTGLVSWQGNDRAINVSPGSALTVTSTNGAGIALTVGGGGTTTFTANNRAYGSTAAMSVTGSGTRLIFSGVNGLDNGTSSIGLTLGRDTTLQLNQTNNYRATLTLNGATVDARAANSLVFQNSSAVTVGGTAASRITSSTGTAGGIQLNSARTFTVNSTGDPSGVDLEIATRISGGSGFTKAGAGTLVLSASNSFGGTTRVNAGRLVVGNQFALANTIFDTQSGAVGELTFANLSEVSIGGLTGSNALVLTTTAGAGLALAVGTSGTSTLTVPLSGLGSLRKVGSGQVTLTAANDYAGPTTVSAGTLVFSSPVTLANADTSRWTAANLVTGSGATTVLAVGGAGFGDGDVATLLAGIDRAVNDNGLKAGSRIGFDTSAAGDFTLGASVQDTTGTGGGAIALVKLGSGTLSLSGSNSYSGGTVVAAGTLRFAAAAALPAAGTIDIRSGAAFVASGAYPTLAQWLASGRIDPASSGAVVLTGNDTAGASLAAYPTLFVGASGSVALSGPLSSGSGGFRFGGGDGVLTVASNLRDSAPLTVIGSGSVVLAGDNVLGTVAVNGGVLVLSSSGALGGGGTISFGGGTLQYSAANTADTSARFSAAANQAIRVDTAGQTVTFAAPLSSTGGSLTKLGSGTLGLAAPGGLTGDTRIVEGVLRLQDRAALQASVLNLAAGDAGTLAFAASGTGPYVLGGLRGDRDLDAGTNAVTVGRGGGSAAFGGRLTAAGLTKVGSGTLAISNLTTVATLGVNLGTVTLDFGTSALNDDIVVPTAGLSLGGGTLRAAGGAGEFNAQSFASTAVVAGASSIVAVSGSGGAVTLNLGSLGRSSQGVLTLALPVSGQVTTTSANTNGILGAWTTVGGTTWAVSGGDGVNAGPVSGLDTFSYGLLNIFGGSDSANSETSTSEALLAPLTTNSLRVLANAAGQTLDLGASRLTLTSGGLISAASGTAAAVTIAGAAGSGGLTAGDGTAPAELIVHQANSGGLTIAAGIVDNGSAAVGVTKAGSGRLTLSGGNTFSGPVAIVGGRLGVTTADAVVSAGGITVYEGSGNQFSLDAAGVTVAQPLTIRGGGAVGVGALQGAVSSGTATYAGPITITGPTQAGGHFASNAGGVLELSGPITHAATAAADRFVNVRDGTAVLSGSGSSYGELRLAAGTIRLGVSNAIPTTASVRVGDVSNAGTTATLDLAGFDQSLPWVTNELTGGNSTSRITSSSGPGTLTIMTPSGSSNTYSGVLTGSLAVVKQAAGTLRLTGISDLAGDVTVQSGTLDLARSQPQFGTITGSSGVVRATAGGVILVSANNALHGFDDGTRPYVIEAGGLLTTADGVTTHATNVALVGGTLASGVPDGTFGSFAFFGTDARLTAGGAAAGTISAEDVRFGTPGFAVEVADGAAAADLVVTGWFGGANGFRKTGAGRMVLEGHSTLSGSTTVEGGVLELANASALASSRLVVVAGGTGQVAPYLSTSVASLDLASGNGLLDLTSGALTISSGLTATELVAEILEGRGDGSWTGTSGITSSTAAAESAAGTPRAVGWIDNGDGSLTAAYAAPGDTNIDWSIDILDAANFLSGGKFDTGSPAIWFEGDFSYDGIVDILDAADFFATGLYDAGNYNTAPGLSGGIAAVPEPGTSGLIVLGLVAAAAAARRRRG